MPVDIDLIRRKGGTREKLKAKFDREKIKPKSKIEQLIEMSASRINEGIQGNLRDARLLWAIDEALDVSKRQITPTLVRGLISASTSKEGVLSAIKQWHLDEMLCPVIEKGCPKLDSAGNPIMKLDVPCFTNIFVPVVLAYTNKMWAKLHMERDLNPLYKYDPVTYTLNNKIKCGIVTDRVQRMVTDMGIREVERQSILQTLQYSISLSFPMEDWYKETQLFGKDAKKKVVREGLRYVLPHARRMFFDMTHRVSTFNSDNGCEWGGYWDIIRFRDIMKDAYWNTEVVDASYGAYGWMGSAGWKLYHELFPCQMKFPDCASGGVRSGDDRINRAIERERCYGNNFKNNAVVVVPFFQKLVPSEWGMYDYDYPVWHRMLFAAEDTVLTVEPLAYSPIVASLYDYDENRAFNTSLALKLLPWQDHLWNYLTQYLLSVKQNLTKAVFWNADLLKQEDINRLQNLGEKMFRSLQFIPFSKREFGFQQQTEREAFFPVNFPVMNTQEIGAAISLMISIMERMLGFSSQEVGAAASHEQSAAEVGIIASNQGVSLQFTGSFIDAARSARKRQLYDAMIAYSDDEIFAGIAEMNDVTRKALEEMGFKVEEEESGDMQAGVRGSKKALILDGFASDRDGSNRMVDSKIATTMIQTFQIMFQSPDVVAAAGVKQLIDMFNQILYYAGAPRDFKLRFQEKIVDPQQQAQEQQKQLEALQKMMAETAQAIVGKEMGEMGKVIKDEVVAPLTQGLEKVGQSLAPLQQGLEQISQIVVPLKEGQQQLGQAVVELVKRQQMSDQKDGVQDEALAGIIQMIQSAAGAVQPPAMAQPGVMA